MRKNGKIQFLIWLNLAFWLILFLVGYYLISCYNRKLTISEPNLERKAFSEFLAQKKKLPLKTEEVTLIAVGDLSYSRGVERAVKRAKDLNYPFRKIRDYLTSADLVFGNLETPITPGREIADFEMIFRSNPGTEQALKEAGFTILSLANNHTPNFGEKGLKDTFYYLKKAGINYVGAGENEAEAYQPVYLTKKGIRLAFLAYNDSDVAPDCYRAGKDRAGTAFMVREKMVETVKEAKQKADFVIVSMHSGTEYLDQPNDSQINFAHAVIEAGADLVIGHHPHVVQPLEKYQGKFIFYSLGNFVFDQPQKQETKEGLAIKIYFSKEKITKISLLPVVMENLAQPRMASEKEAERILARLNFPLEDQTVYFWNEEKNIFEKTVWKMVVNSQPKAEGILSKQEQDDLDNDSLLEIYSLANGHLTIKEDERTIWQSPDDWWIDDFVLADSTNDGIQDINLSLWKAGNFGSSRPFWIKENDPTVKNHFFILNFTRDLVRQIWGSSNLSVPNYQFKIADVDDDNQNELIVIEGGHLAVWRWNGWGFSNQWRSEEGSFSHLTIEKINGKSYILVNPGK